MWFLFVLFFAPKARIKMKNWLEYVVGNVIDTEKSHIKSKCYLMMQKLFHYSNREETERNIKTKTQRKVKLIVVIFIGGWLYKHRIKFFYLCILLSNNLELSVAKIDPFPRNWFDTKMVIITIRTLPLALPTAEDKKNLFWEGFL